MYFKIALHNVKKSIKDYTIYFLTLAFGICLFYLFNSIHSQQAILEINESQRSMLALIQTMISGISIFVAVILGLLIIYANQYLMKRRHKEMGIYLLLGMEKGQVSRILILETLFIGIFALAAGLAAGIFLSQGFSILTAKMFAVKMKEFQFIFSREAFLQTILYFVLIFLIVMLFNGVSISRYKIIDLLHSGKKNQKMRIKNLWISVVLFIISIVCLGAAYYNIWENGMMQVDWQFKLSIVLGIAGTFLFFFSLSGCFLNLVKGRKGFYYRGLNLFIFRQLNSKITTTFISMSMLCLMLFLAICAFATGTGMAETLNSNLEAVSPFDYSLYVNSDEDGNLKSGDEVLNDLKRDGIEIEKYAEPVNTITLYYQKDGTDRNLTMEPFLKGRESLSSYPKKQVEELMDENISLIRLSDYNNFLKIKGRDPITLKKNQYAVSCNFENVKDAFQDAVDDGQELTINGQKMKPLGRMLTDVYVNTSIQMDAGTLILPDDVMDKMQIKPVFGYINILWKSSYSGHSEVLSHEIEDVYGDDQISPSGNQRTFQSSFSREEVYEQGAGLSTIIIYIAIYIGIVFLITSAAVLALQQLSENADNLPKYRLLARLGTEDQMIRSAIKAQIITYFLIPMSLALVHSYVAIRIVSIVISQLGHMDVAGAVFKSVAAVLCIYGGYMAATYFGSKNMLRDRS